MNLGKIVKFSHNDKCSLPVCPSCNDGIQNCGEIDIDCGGLCGACAVEAEIDDGQCPSCNDGIHNCDEEGVDCGGSCIPCEVHSCPCSATATTPCDCSSYYKHTGYVEVPNELASKEAGSYSDILVRGELHETPVEDLKDSLKETFEEAEEIEVEKA